MNQFLYLQSLVVFGTLASGKFLGPCCFKKTVGGISYTLVNDYTNTDEYGCQSNCVYQNDDVVGSRYCFAKGGQEVECIKEGSKGERFIDEFAICNKELKEFIQNVATAGDTHTYRFCNGTYGNCNGHGCLGIFGDSMCARHVTNTGNLSQCESKIGYEFVALFGVTGSNCENYAKHLPKAKCPGNSWDPKCNCCKYPDYTGKCGTECRCKGACDWFAWNNICNSYTSVCCSCSSSTYCSQCALKGICNNCPTPTPPPVPLPYNPPVPVPSPTPVPSPPPPKECKDCHLKIHADNLYCKCSCLCRKISENTGSKNINTGKNCTYPWNMCWMDFAFCCECKKEKYPTYSYEKVCPGYCNETTSPGTANEYATIASDTCN